MKRVPDIEYAILNIIYNHPNWKHSCYYLDEFVDLLPKYKESSILYHLRLLVKSGMITRVRAIPTFYEPIDDEGFRDTVCETVRTWLVSDSSGKS